MDSNTIIESQLKELTKSFPLGAGLTSISNIINHLPSPKIGSNSLFSSSTRTNSDLEEPLFIQFQQQISTLLTSNDKKATGGSIIGEGNSVTSEVENWRRNQMERVRESVLEDGINLQVGLGNIQFQPPPFPILPSSSSVATTSPPTTSSHAIQLLDSLSIPTSFHSSTVQTPILTEPDPEKFFQQFLTEKRVGRVTRSSVAAATINANSHASGSGMQVASNGQNGSSSLAPSAPIRKSSKGSILPLASSSSSSSSTSGHPIIPRNQSQTHNGSQRLMNTPPPSSEVGGNSSPLSSLSSDDSPFAVVIESPRKKIVLRPFVEEYSEGGGGKKITDSQRAHMSETPVKQVETPVLGVESAVKRIRLVEGSIGTATYSGTARSIGTGTGGRNGDSKELIEKFSDLLSDIFSADDSFIIDTSSSHLPSNSASASASTFFHQDATTTDNRPLLQTDILKRLIKSLSMIKAKNKGSEMLTEVEEGGVGRLLKVLERSWSNMEELNFWEKAALKEKKESMGDLPETGKGKGRVAAGGKKGGVKGKGKAVAGRKKLASKNIMEEEDDSDDDGQEESYSPTKSIGGASGRASRSRSNSPSVSSQGIPAGNKSHEMDLDEIEEGEESIWTESALETFNEAVSSLSDAILAIRAALSLLTITTLPKQLYSSDFITSIFTVLRHSLDGFLYPLLEATTTSHLYELANYESNSIRSICDSVEIVIPLVNLLVHNEEMSEEIVIATVYYSLSPFFHESPTPPSGPSTSKAKKVELQTVALAMKGIRLASLGLIRTVIGRYPVQRAWIIEEVLSNLTKLETAKKGKGGFRLRNGSSIHTVSALILHLVQTSPTDLRGSMTRRLSAQAKDKLLDVEMKDSGDREELKEEDEEDVGKGVLELAVRDVIEPALDAASKSARTVISYLLTKSCKAGKVAAGSTESEYRAIFDNLVTDLLATLHLPEWPASEVLLSICCKSMITTLADPKSTHELNALKGVSLDHLGPIGARVRKDATAVTATSEVLPKLQEALVANNIESLNKIFNAEMEVLAHLLRSEKAEGSSGGAAAFTAAIFGRDLYQALQASNTSVSRYTATELTTSEEGRAIKAFNDRIITLSTEFWTLEPQDDIFGPSTADNQVAIDSLNVQLAQSQSLAGLYDLLLDRLVDAAESSAVSFRTKALRGISLVVAQDPELFHRPDVKRSIENRMLDSSPAVRDTAIELVGKYVVGRLDLAVEYLPQICDRIVDTGLGVRRRVVKLLKTLYTTLEEEDHRVKIATQLVWRSLDEDDGIRDLAVEAVEELWFTRPVSANSNDESQDAASKKGIAQLASIIMSVTGRVGGNVKDRPPPVDDVLRLIIAKHAEKGTKPPLNRLRQVTEALIDGLVEQDESLNVVACIKTIYILNSADPSLLSTAKATLLLPFLKSATGPEELATSEFLLKIFRSTVIASPKAGSKFARDLQSSLTLMLNKPTLTGGILPHIVACFCAVVRGQTHDFSHMIDVFAKCSKLLEKELKTLRDPATAAKGNPRAIPLLASLSALLCEHGQFDDIRRNFPETEQQIDVISKNQISIHIFQMLIDLYNLRLNPSVQTAVQMQVLVALGFIFRAYPQLMVTEKSTTIMDGIFDSNVPQSQARLLKMLQEFLSSQESPAMPIEKVKVETGVKIAELVGNVDGFANSGVSSAICQRYDSQIIAAALSVNPLLQRVAIDILTSMARSGFIHPLSVLPPLVALTASPDQAFARKAYATLSLVQQKHGNLCATRFAEPAKQTHNYMKVIASTGNATRNATGYRGDPPTSHFGPWYNLIREKRQTRLDYLKTLSRMLELEPGAKCTENDVSLARFVAEALSTLEYKTQEEPMSIIAHLNAMLAVAGLQVLHLLEEGIEGGGGLLGSSAPSSPVKANSMEIEVETTAAPPSLALTCQSIICGVALLLRDHLKILYSITEIKMTKFTLGKKSPIGDRPTTTRTDASLALGLDSYQRMPFAVLPLTTLADRSEQRETYITLIGSDGTIGPIELDLDEEE